MEALNSIFDSQVPEKPYNIFRQLQKSPINVLYM